MTIKRMLSILLLTLSLMVMTGCAANKNTETTKSTELSNTTVVPSTTYNTEIVETTVADELYENYLNDAKSETFSLDDRLIWMDENLSRLSPEQASVVLMAFEVKHRTESFEKMDLLYENGFQDLIQSTSLEAIETLAFDALEPQLKIIKENIAYLLSHGYRFEPVEGSLNVLIDYNFYAPYLSFVTDDVTVFYEQMKAESTDVPLKDAAVVIEWNELFNRTTRWESFSLSYPESLLIERGEQLFTWYRDWAFNGAPNTPVFDYDSLMVTNDYRKGIETFLDSNPTGGFADSMREFYERLKGNQFILNDAIKAFQNQFVVN